jgi:two-component system, response regulator
MKNKKTVVLIEDNPSDADLAKRVLNKIGNTHPLVHLEDGQDALNYFFYQDQYEGTEHDNSPALVLLDLKLPIIDGIEVLRQLRNNPSTKHLIIVVLSSSVEESDIIKTYDLGVNSYIKKPVDYNTFIEVMQQVWNYWLGVNVSIHN